MKYLSPKTLIIAVLVLTAGSAVIAQEGPPPQDAGQFSPQPQRPNLLEALGLSPDQVKQIRSMNRDRKPLMEAAQQRLRETNRALDMAVYRDELDDADFRLKLKEFQDAQAEVARIRFQSELSLRKILTPEQLVKFRGLRAKAAEARENFRRRGDNPRGARPLNRIRQLPRRSRVN
jgi:Spy/CpxP family protein refolding chaperone